MDGVTYFTITLKDNRITLDQKDGMAIWHEKGGDTDNAANLFIKDGSLKLTVTITDGDGDTASHEVDLGKGALTFNDDGPDINVGKVADGGIKIVTQDADTVNGTDTATDEVQPGTYAFKEAFLAAVAPTYGADGEGSKTVSDFKLAIDSTDSGLTIHGKPISLAMAGLDVVGSAVGYGEVFRISVDKDTGKVTLTQSQEVDHAQGSNHIDLPDGWLAAPGA